MLRVKNNWVFYTIFMLLLVTAVLAWGIWQKTQLDQSSRAVVNETIQNVLLNSNYSLLISSALDGRLNDRPAEGYESNLAAMKTALGSLDEVIGIYGEAQVPLINLFAPPVVANYEADLNFASGPATLQITLQRQGGDWKTSRFQISARQLLN